MAVEDKNITLLRIIKHGSCQGITVSCCSIPDDTTPYVPCPFGSSDRVCHINCSTDVYKESINMFIKEFGEEGLFDILL